MTYLTFHKSIKHTQAREDECKHTPELIENTAQISLIHLSPLQGQKAGVLARADSALVNKRALAAAAPRQS